MAACVSVVHTAAAKRSSPLAGQLRESNYDVSVVPVGRSMVDDLLAIAPDVVVVGHSTGAFDVTRVCHDISTSVPARIVVVSCDESNNGDESLEIAVLDAGADDFLHATVSTKVLLARIRVALRRRVTLPQQLSRLAVGDVIIDLEAHALFIGGAAVKCPPLQFLLLVVLAKRPNQVVERDALLASVWGTEPASVDPRRVQIGRASCRERV